MPNIIKSVLPILLFGLMYSANCAIVTGSADENNVNNISGRGIDAKGMLTALASNLMGRGYVTTGAGATGSQVVSLNLTNLFVLVLLKALIFAAGSLGAGTWKGGLGRSNDGEESILTDEEILMFLSYLTGDNSCLQNIACHQPLQAQKYVTAGDMLLKASRFLSPDMDNGYQSVLKAMEQAAQVGIMNGDCAKFQCAPTEDKQ